MFQFGRTMRRIAAISAWPRRSSGRRSQVPAPRPSWVASSWSRGSTAVRQAAHAEPGGDGDLRTPCSNASRTVDGSVRPDRSRRSSATSTRAPSASRSTACGTGTRRRARPGHHQPAAGATAGRPSGRLAVQHRVLRRAPATIVSAGRRAAGGGGHGPAQRRPWTTSTTRGTGSTTGTDVPHRRGSSTRRRHGDSGGRSWSTRTARGTGSRSASPSATSLEAQGFSSYQCPTGLGGPAGPEHQGRLGRRATRRLVLGAVPRRSHAMSRRRQDPPPSRNQS